MKILKLLILTVNIIMFTSLNGLSQTFQNINKKILFNKIDQDSTHTFFIVFIFTNNCAGTKHIPQHMKDIDSITTNKSRYFVCQTSGGNDRGKALLKVVTENGFQSKDVYSIDETTYNINKKDSRSQGMLFRDDLCYECKFVETGVAYKIIFDKQKNILFNGFFIDTKQLDAILNCSN